MSKHKDCPARKLVRDKRNRLSFLCCEMLRGHGGEWHQSGSLKWSAAS